MILLENARIFDGMSESPLEGPLVIDGARIVEIGNTPPSNCEFQRIDCGGRILIPGLIDAHIHACAPSFSFYDNDRMPVALAVIYAARTLEGMLQRGFTTVRDAGGADRGLWLAIERKLVQAPRLFYSGRAISQTGGHGDMRPWDRNEPCACDSYAGTISRVADGVEQVRSAVREELRQGAAQIKLFVSGGVTSPNDPIWMNQFTDSEIAAAVEEAATRRTYVMAHCHTDEAVRRCAALGVRSIEHGTQVSSATATLLAAKQMYVVPTLSVAQIARTHGKTLGMPIASLHKLEGVYEQMAASIKECERAGVKLGLGSDILGYNFQALQGGELALRGEIQRPIEVLRSATSVNAALLNMSGQLGCIAPGAFADVLAINGDPFQDLELFRDPMKNIALVMKDGEVVRSSL
jgi:imidazolonepropionase-like amidohydrolase